MNEKEIRLRCIEFAIQKGVLADQVLEVAKSWYEWVAATPSKPPPYAITE